MIDILLKMKEIIYIKLFVLSDSFMRLIIIIRNLKNLKIKNLIDIIIRKDV